MSKQNNQNKSTAEEIVITDYAIENANLKLQIAYLQNEISSLIEKIEKNKETGTSKEIKLEKK